MKRLTCIIFYFTGLMLISCETFSQVNCTSLDGQRTLSFNPRAEFPVPAGTLTNDGSNFICADQRSRHVLTTENSPKLQDLLGTTKVGGVNYGTIELQANLNYLVNHTRHLGAFAASQTHTVLNSPSITVADRALRTLSRFSSIDLLQSEEASGQVVTALEEDKISYILACERIVEGGSAESDIEACPYSILSKAKVQYYFHVSDVITEFVEYLRIIQNGELGHGLCGLTFSEYQAIKNYSLVGYHLVQLNPNLLNNDGRILRDYFIGDLQSGLAKIGRPSQINTVFRGGLIDRPAGSMELEVGVTSTSTSILIAMNFMRGNPDAYLLKITNLSKASYVRDIAVVPGENEVIFERIRFKIDEEWNCTYNGRSFHYAITRQCPDEDCSGLSTPQSRNPASIKKSRKQKK